VEIHDLTAGSIVNAARAALAALSLADGGR
jgi:hypothetical protein